MGGGKPTAELGGRALISYPLRAFAEAGIEASVWAKPDTELPPLEAPVLREPSRPRHPLCGIVAALRAADGQPAADRLEAAAPRSTLGGRGTERGRPLVVAACDMPFLAPGLIAHLAAAAEPLVIPVLGGRLQPLLGRYDPALLPELEEALAREEPLTRTVESLRPRLVDEVDLRRFGDPRRLLFNVNDPRDLDAAEAMLRSR